MPSIGGVVSPTERPAPPAARMGLGRWMVIGIVIGGFVVLALAGLIGYKLNDQPERLVTVSGTFDGTVSKLNADQTSGCITDSSDQPHCGGIVVVDNVKLTTGEKLRVAELTGELNKHLSFNELYVYDPNRVSY